MFVLFVISEYYYLSNNVLRFRCPMSSCAAPLPSSTDAVSVVCSTSSVTKHCFANGFENVMSSGLDSHGNVTPVMN